MVYVSRYGVPILRVSLSAASNHYSFIIQYSVLPLYLLCNISYLSKYWDNLNPYHTCPNIQICTFYWLLKCLKLLNEWLSTETLTQSGSLQFPQACLFHYSGLSWYLTGVNIYQAGVFALLEFFFFFQPKRLCILFYFFCKSMCSEFSMESLYQGLGNTNDYHDFMEKKRLPRYPTILV